MRITILGSGTSHGVPMIGCRCDVCTSLDPLNRRLRPSITVEWSGRTVLVDATPDFRTQALANSVERVDAVLVTHTHADHIMGLDEIRRFNDLQRQPIPVYGEPNALDDVRRIYRYVFVATQEGGGKPRIELVPVTGPFELFGALVDPLRVMHGELPILAYRIGSIAYVTDVSHIPPSTIASLAGLDLLIIDSVRPKPHPTHFGLRQALEAIDRLQPRRTLLTHLSHKYDHHATNAELPRAVSLAYDGQVIEVADPGPALPSSTSLRT